MFSESFSISKPFSRITQTTGLKSSQNYTFFIYLSSYVHEIISNSVVSATLQILVKRWIVRMHEATESFSLNHDDFFCFLVAYKYNGNVRNHLNIQHAMMTQVLPGLHYDSRAL